MDRNTPGALPDSGDDAPPPFRDAKARTALRDEAIRILARIADESGTDSRLHRLCAEIWRQRDADARLSLSHGDAANARVVLERAVHLLTLGPCILARSELAFADLELLLRAA